MMVHVKTNVEWYTQLKSKTGGSTKNVLLELTAENMLYQ